MERKIIPNTVKIFKDVRIENSNLNDNCSIGDFSSILNSNFDNNVIIHKNNYITNSNIGKRSYTGPNTMIFHSLIGKYNSISWNVTIGGGEHDYSKLTTHAFLYNTNFNLNQNLKSTYNRFSIPCEIGNDVWIGANSTLLRGIKISNGVVIGANSVVTKDLPPYSICVGNPAKVIKYRFKPEIIDSLENLKWWDLEDHIIKENINFFNEGPTIETIDYFKKIIKKF